MSTADLWRRVFPHPPSGFVFLRYDHARLTLKRLYNLQLLKREYQRGAIRLRSYPIKLVLEATNICNLSCPACFTGAGENGRLRSSMTLDVYRKILNELGDYLLEIEFYNWGEPLLSKYIYSMIGEAHARGLATTVSTNFSLPFDAAKAEQLVRSGLSILGVSIDGARQESYEQYRVGGNLQRVLDNCRLVIEAKRRLGATNPKVIWEFHVFEHNVADTDLAHQMWREIGFDELTFSKGYTLGQEWNPDSPYKHFPPFYTPVRCAFLWQYAIIHNDGGVAPCCGTFYREDDMGTLSVKPGDLGARTFRDLWNGPNFRGAREFYRTRAETPENRGAICFDCPQTVVWNNFKRHVAEGREPYDFHPGFSANDGYNYFWNRRPTTRDTKIVLRPDPQPAPSRAAAR
jgi:pyruvate-formate lyase-activating enzyme